MYIPLERAEKAAFEVLQETHILFLSGKEGSGKTTMAVNLMKKLRQKLLNREEDFYSVEVNDNADLKVALNENRKMIIFIDDPFGKSNFRNNDFEDWEKYFEELKIKKKDKSIYFICSIRNNVLKECEEKLKKYEIFNKDTLINLSSEKWSLTQGEKWYMIDAFCKDSGIKISHDSDQDLMVENVGDFNRPAMIHGKVVGSISHTDPVIGFPQSCNLFFRDVNIFKTGLSFFKNARENLKKEISNLYSRSKYTKKIFATMVMMLINGGKIDFDKMRREDIKIKHICDSLDIKLKTIDMKNTLQEDKYFVEISPNTYGFSHETILESILLSLAEEEEWQELILKFASDDIIVEFVRSDGYSPIEDEVHMKLKKDLDEKFLERLIDIYSKEEMSLRIFPYPQRFDHVPEISVIRHPSIQDKSLSALLWRQIEKKKVLYSANRLHTFFKCSCIYQQCWLIEETLCRHGVKEKNDLPVLQRQSLIEGLKCLLMNKGNFKILDIIMKHDSSLLYANLQEDSPVISFAISSRLKKCVQYLIEHTEDLLQIKTKQLNNVLHECVSCDWPDLIQMILVKNPELLKCQNSHGYTPLMRAASMGMFENVFFLLNSKFLDLDDLKLYSKDGNTILHICISNMAPDFILEKIVSLDSDLLTVQNNRGKTPLMSALDGKTFISLMKFNPDISIKDNENNIFLHHVLVWINIEQSMLQEMIHGSPTLLNAKNNYGETPIMIARHEESIISLLRLGADISQNINGNNLLHYCVNKSGHVCSEIIKRDRSLLYQKNNMGKTPIECAVEDGKFECVRVMLLHDEKLKCVNKHTGSTLLHLAVMKGKLEVCQVILEFDKSLLNTRDTSYRSMTPVLMAAFFEKKTIFEFLMAQNCDINVKDIDMNTVLHYCARNFWLEMCDKLIGDDQSLVNAFNKNGDTPLLYTLAYMVKRNINSFHCNRRCHHQIASFRNVLQHFTPIPYLTNYVPLFSQIIRTFILNAANLAVKTEEGNNILHFISDSCHFEKDSRIISEILKVETKIMNDQNSSQRTPIILAAHTGHLSIVKTLLKEDAEVTHQDKYGKNVLDYCFMTCDPELVLDIIRDNRTLLVMWTAKVFRLWLQGHNKTT